MPEFVKASRRSGRSPPSRVPFIQEDEVPWTGAEHCRQVAFRAGRFPAEQKEFLIERFRQSAHGLAGAVRRDQRSRAFEARDAQAPLLAAAAAAEC